MEWLTSEGTVFITTGLIVCFYVAYRYITRNNDYFAKRNVPYIKPAFLFGNFGPMLMRKTSPAEYFTDLYNQLREHRIGGIFQFSQPMYMVRDPELIKLVTVKDFDYFVDIPMIIPEDAEPIMKKNLLALKGQKWKDMRSVLTPAFTSSKIKMMFTLVCEIGQQLISHLESCLKERQTLQEYDLLDDPADVLPLEVKKLFTKYTNDVIATSAFGVKCDSLENPDNEFYKTGQEFNKFTFKKFISSLLYFIFPKIMKMFGVRLMSQQTCDFFRTLMVNSIRIREQEGIVRPDMIHLLMQVQKDDLLQEESSDTTIPELDSAALQNNIRKKKMNLDIDDIAAQALVFFSAGFESVASLLSFSTILLAVHQDIQQQARDEVDKILAKHGGEITYEAVQNLKLLDNILSETLRVYPSAPLTSRKCVKEYKVPGSDIKIEEGSIVTIPLRGLHYDPEYFPDPENFNPDRFSDDNKHNIQPFTYMPFGSGPRHCIANRFALMETKTALVHLLSHFEIHTTSKTKLPLRLSKNFSSTIEGGFWVGFKLRTPKSGISYRKLQ